MMKNYEPQLLVTFSYFVAFSCYFISYEFLLPN